MQGVRSILVVTLLSCFVIVDGTKDTIGTLFEDREASAMEQGAQGIFLMHDIVFPRAAVYQLDIYCVKADRAVWIQIWRPVGEQTSSDMSYKLIDQKQLDCGNQRLPSTFTYRMTRRDEFIFTEKGDRPAIYHETDQSPVAYEFQEKNQSTLNRVYITEEKITGYIPLNTTIQVLEFAFPYRFAVSATFDTDVERYQVPGTVIPPTVPPTRIQTVPPMPPNFSTTSYHGNDLLDTNQWMTSDARGLYLLPHVTFPRGVITSFMAYFMTSAPIVFQAWRLVEQNATFQTYILVDQVRVEPQWFPWREQVSLSMGSYIFTEQGDILGFYVDSDVNPIGYQFIYGGESSKPLLSSLAKSQKLWPGYRHTFSTVATPRHFSVGAYVDTDRSEIKYGTPRPIIDTTTAVPTTTTPMPTTVPGLVRRPALGEANLKYTNRALVGDTKTTFIIRDLVFPQPAKVTAFYAYFVKTGSVEFLVYRKTRDSKWFTLVGRKSYVSNVTGYTAVELQQDEEITVETGDCVGFHNRDPTRGSIGYHFEASELYYNATDFNFTPNRTTYFEQMPLPYVFSLAVSYSPIAPTTIEPPATPETGASVSGDSLMWLKDERFLLAMFIWLCVLTFVFIIMCGVMMCRTQSRRKAYRAGPGRHSSFTNPVTTSRPPSFSHKYNTSLKVDDVIDYYNPNGNASRADVTTRDVARMESKAGYRPEYHNQNRNNNDTKINTHM